MSGDTKQQNTKAIQYDTVLCAVPSKEIQDYIDLIEYNTRQMFKMYGIPKEMLGADKTKQKRK